MARLAILEYVVTSEATYVVLIKDGFEQPLIFEARDDGGGVSLTDLELCAARLIIDFHGLPPNWDLQPSTKIREALRLSPAVPAAKRGKGVLERTLGNPNFHYEMDYWDRLGSRLFPAALRPHLEDCVFLAIVPHGPLHALPMASLRWTESQFLIERFGLCFAPSLSVLRSCRAKNPRRGEDHATAARGAMAAAVAAADDLNPALFEGDTERLAQIWETCSPGASLLQLTGAMQRDSRTPATKAAILREMPGHEIIHLACHGVFSADDHSEPLDSGLLVSDGERVLGLSDAAAMPAVDRQRWILSAREIFGLRLQAGLVTLRACSSGRSALKTGDELFGLTRAFLYAGAASLIVSLWNVHQKSSQLLLETFYEAWAPAVLAGSSAPTPKWKAMQQAQIALLRGGYPHPFHWAPFILLGDWL
jgi:CHAT domain-containing protein